MILDIDVGNSLCKWRLTATSEPVRSGTCTLADLLSGQAFAQFRVERVRISSVRSEESNLAIGAWTEAWLQCRAEFAIARREMDGLTIAYAVPEKLGVDRWLSMLAAWKLRRRPFCIIQCGTAITADIVDGSGCHRGGYIVPGLRMLQESLLGNTDRVRFSPSNSPESSVWPGTDTASAVEHGAMLAAIGFSERAIEMARSLCGPCDVLIAGGDAAEVQSRLHVPASLVQGLVLDGLAVAMP